MVVSIPSVKVNMIWKVPTSVLVMGYRESTVLVLSVKVTNVGRVVKPAYTAVTVTVWQEFGSAMDGKM